MIRTVSIICIIVGLLSSFPLTDVSSNPDTATLLSDQFTQTRALVEAREFLGAEDLEWQ